MSAPLSLSVLFTCLGIVIVVVLYAFYLNRAVAWLVAAVLRLRLWDPTSSPGSIHVSIEALQFSLLSGRLLLKDVRYTSSNQSLRIVKMKITWKYWLWNTRQGIDVALEPGEPDQGRRYEKDAELPCRVAVYMEGVEWFLYNRTWSYEDVLARLKRPANHEQTHQPAQHVEGPLHGVTSRGSTTGGVETHYAWLLTRASRISGSLVRWCAHRVPTLDWMELLPISIRIEKGAIVLGNASVQSIVVARFTHANGTFDVAQSRCALDLYKQVLNLTFRHVLVTCNPNPDYDEPMLETGRKVFEHVDAALDGLDFASFRELLQNYRRDAPKSPLVQDRTQYAQWENVLSTKALEITYYADVAGEVQGNAVAVLHDKSGLDVGNGDLPPEWGIEMVVHSAELTYGPWTDRQRAELQRVFFPQTFHDSHPTAKLQAGETRLCVEMAVLIDLRGTTSLRIPFREASKDWQYDVFGDPTRSKSAKRGPTWLDVKFGSGSMLRYSMPMVADENGFGTTLDFSATDVSVAGLDRFEYVFLKADTLKILGKMPTPLQWNAHRQWDFTVSLARPSVHLLRDHITLLTDLIKDWVSGPPSDPFRFVPITYALAVNLANFDIVLYLNDHNIVDQLFDTDKNALLTLSGASLTNTAVISSDVYRPESSSVPFTIEIPDVAVRLTLPKWNTHSLFASRATTDIGRIGLLQVDGTYFSYADVREDFVDRLHLNVAGSRVALKSFGWAVRHFMILKDNYFGAFTNQSTVNEYRHTKDQGRPVGDPVEEKYRPGKSNIFEVIVDIKVEDALMVMPAGLAGCEVAPVGENAGLGHCFAMTIPELGANIRLHDYYMEMSLNIQPIIGSVVADVLDADLFGQHRIPAWKEMVLIDGIHITGNRIFGPLPRNPTYLCLWEIQLGTIKTSLSIHDAHVLSCAVRSFGVTMSDAVNAPAAEYVLPSDPDVTFLKVMLEGVDVAINAPRACLHFALPSGLELSLNDLAGKSYRKHIGVQLPEGTLRCLVSMRDDGQHWLEAGSFNFDAFLDVYQAPAGWIERARQQQEFVREQDAPTRRAPFLYEGGNDHRARLASYQNSLFLPHPQPPNISPVVPELPHTTTVPSHGSFGRLSRIADSPKRHSAIHELGDSGDEDEGVSEADRDARIARSRPVTPRSSRIAYVDVDNDSLSSGDESDDADESTDDASSESEWSGDGDEDSFASSGPWPYTASYVKLVPHYKVALGLLWDSPLVTLDATPSLSKRAAEAPHRSPKPAQATDTPRWFLPRAESDVTGRTTVRFRTDRVVEAFLSPLLVPFVDSMIRAQELEEQSLELVMDDHIVQASMKAGVSASSTGRLVLDVGVSALRIRTSQRIMSADEAASFLPDKPPPPVPTQSHVVSIIDIQVTGLGVLADIAPDSLDGTVPIRRLQLRHDALSFHLREAQSHAQSGMNRSSRSLSTEVEALTGPLRVFIAGTKSCVQTGDFSLRFQERSSEAVIGTAAAVLRTVRQCTSRVETRREQVKTRFRRFFILAVTASQHKPTITDPLSQAQPSLLLRSGYPASIRADPQWRMLTHLRHGLRFFSNDERASLHRQSELKLDIDRAEIPAVHTVLRRRLGEWTSSESDAADPYWVPLQKLLFPNERIHQLEPTDGEKAPTRPRWWMQPFSFNLTTGISSMSLLQSDNMTNELMAGPFNVSIRSRACFMLPPAVGTSTSQVSVNQSARDIIRFHQRTLLHVHASLDLHSSKAAISPNLIPFARHLVRVFRGFAGHFRGPPRTPASPTVPRDATPAPFVASLPVNFRFDITLRLRNLVFSMLAQQISLELRVRELQSGLNADMARDQASFKAQSISAATLFGFEDLTFSARDLLQVDAAPTDARNVLASLTLGDARLSGGVLVRDEQPTKVHAALQLRAINLAVPRSVMRLYNLVEEWRRQYLPELELMFQGLVSELDRKPKRKTRARFATQASTLFDVHFLLQELRITLHVMHGTWLCWTLEDTVAYAKNAHSTAPSDSLSFGLEIGLQEFSIGPNAGEAESGAVKLTLPACRVGGTAAKRELKCLAVIETFRWTFKPKHFDDILAIQQKFGADFNELLDLVGETRRGRPASARDGPRMEATPWKYDVQVKLVSFRIGVAGPSTIQYFSAAGVTGGISNFNGRTWHLSVTGLGLGLVRKVPEEGSPFHLSSAMAFISVDIRMKTVRKDSQPEKIEINVPRLHAVMQPASIGELGDLVDYVQAEMLAQSERRAAEIAEMRRKTKKVLRAWDVRTKPSNPQDPSSLFDNRIITLIVSNLGVAFPLSQDCDIALQETDRHASVAFSTTSTPAFLLSINAMEFCTRRYETGTAIVKGFAFQFVQRFDQALPSDFDGKSHHTRNRLLYPMLTAEVRSQTSASTRSLHILGAVDGFTLDLDPSIATYVFALNDVYHQGKDRMERIVPVQEDIAAALPRSTSEPLAQEPTRFASIPTSHVRLKLTFASGRVRMHAPAPRGETRTLYPELDATKDIFNLPSLSVWMEYKATTAAKKFGGGSGDDEHSSLIFSAVLHESHNTFKPSVLPFLTDLRRTIEARMRRRDSRHMPSPSFPPAVDAISVATTSSSQPAAISSMRIHISLRIDESSLRLSCFPDVSIMSGVYWKSGGFMITIAPGARKIGFTGSIAGVTAELRHEYLKEVFFEARTENLAFAVAFSKTKNPTGDEVNSVSIVVDAELTAHVNFSRLQDGYCFKAVWLDRLPVFESTSTQRREPSSAGLLAPPPTSQKSMEDVPFSTLILVRSRRLALSVDLAQAATMTLDLNSFVARTHLSENLADISMSFSDLNLKSERLVFGHAKLPEFSFQTLRRRRPKGTVSSSADQLRLLQLALIFGRLEMSLLHGGEHKVFHYEADPVRIHVFDDWARATSGGAGEQQLSLNFSVVGTSISVAVGLAIARKVVEVQDKIKNLFQTQREGALRDSKAFRSTWTPAPANPLSEVANAMIESARTRFKEHSGLSFIVVQKMLLKLAKLKINVFPTFMTDDALATFQGVDLLAQLQRVVAAEDVPHQREMTASFSSILMSKFTGLPRDRPALPDGEVGSAKWLASLVKNAREDPIISIPTMFVKMLSEELEGGEDGAGPKLVIRYRFDSQFVKTGKAADSDIYVTLNYTHYTWLTNLKKTVEREIAQFKREKAISSASITAPRVVTARRRDETKAPAVSPSQTSPVSPPMSPAMHKASVSVSSVPTQHPALVQSNKVQYVADEVHIETPLLRQLGEATPSLDSSWVQSLSGIKFRERFPQYLHEFATVPLEEMMKMLLELYSKQLKMKDVADSAV